MNVILLCLDKKAVLDRGKVNRMFSQQDKKAVLTIDKIKNNTFIIEQKNYSY